MNALQIAGAFVVLEGLMARVMARELAGGKRRSARLDKRESDMHGELGLRLSHGHNRRVPVGLIPQ